MLVVRGPDGAEPAASLCAGGRVAVPGQIPTGDIHHLRLTVTDVERSRQFYTSLLGFEVAVESPPDDDPELS